MSWTLAHSVGMLLVVGAALALGDARPIAAFGAASFAVLVALRAGSWTPTGRFGVANSVTALRVLMIVVLSALPRIGPAAALLVAASFALDGLDGLLARRNRTESSFGALFDMETDALLVLVAAFRLAHAGRLGPFIVLPGLYRYLYAVAISVGKTVRGDAPRSDLGRYVFAVMVTSLALSLWPLEPIHEKVAVLATLLITLSFARSASWSFFGV
ncbi:MAG TPA: CDP-alcohol phosphatidyltransferase family protein [Polyangiaceae bacterium]